MNRTKERERLERMQKKLDQPLNPNEENCAYCGSNEWEHKGKPHTYIPVGNPADGEVCLEENETEER